MSATIVAIDDRFAALSKKRNPLFDAWLAKVLSLNEHSGKLSENDFAFLKNRFDKGCKPEAVTI
jgi:hypothetical protein